MLQCLGLAKLLSLQYPLQFEISLPTRLYICNINCISAKQLMKKKLYQNAFITFPIIALYGASPFYIFDKIDLPTFLLLVIGLSVNVLLVWLVQIYFALKYPQLNNYKQFLYTYIVNTVIRLSFFFIDPFPNFVGPGFREHYIAYPIATSFVLNAIIMVLVNSIVNGYKRIEAEMQVNELKLQQSEAQKQALIQQLHPHFLFNALGNLKSLISENAAQAEQYALKLSDFLRYSVEAHRNETVPLQKELEFTKDYIELQKVRFGHAFTYSINIPEEALKLELPVLALQTLVENIFKHNNFSDRAPLAFSISYKNHCIQVANKKSPIKPTDATKTGLANLQKRYQLTMSQSISVEDTEHEFNVTLPLLVK